MAERKIGANLHNCEDARWRSDPTEITYLEVVRFRFWRCNHRSKRENLDSSTNWMAKSANPILEIDSTPDDIVHSFSNKLAEYEQKKKSK